MAGAGPGETVLVLDEGNGARQVFASKDGPVRSVIVGIVDYGCDFAHGNFRNADGATRLLYLWDQNGGETALTPDGYQNGREFDAAAINAALASPQP